MKIELEQEDIEAIAQRVVELIKPLLTNCKQEQADKLLTAKELSEYLGYSIQWVYNNKNKLCPEYVSGKPLFRLSKINSLLREKKQKSETPELKERAFRKRR